MTTPVENERRIEELLEIVRIQRESMVTLGETVAANTRSIDIMRLTIATQQAGNEALSKRVELLVKP